MIWTSRRTVSYTHLDVYKRQPVFRPADRGEAESISQKRDLEQSGRQDQRADHGAPQNLVLPPQAENGFSLRTEVEGMEYLAHGHSQKRHCHCLLYTSTDRFEHDAVIPLRPSVPFFG